MLNNPDIQPNATINRWIAGILLFDFKLVHVPADNPNTQQTPEYTKDKYNVKIIKQKSLLRSHQQPV
jgi:hypothetical protein